MKNQLDKLYNRWNQSTAACYYHKMICKNCPNEMICRRVKEKLHGMPPMKYAMLQTYANIGTQGLERYINDTRDE